MESKREHIAELGLSPTAVAQIQRVGQAMLAELDTMLAEMADRVWDTVPGYSQFVPDRGEVRNRISESVTIIIGSLTQGTLPDEKQLAKIAAAGERRALQGVPSSALIQSFRIAERTLGEELAQWCERMQVRSKAARAARTWFLSTLDLLEGTMLDAYGVIRDQIETDARLSESNLFRRAAAGMPIEAAEAARLAAAIGVADAQHASFVVIAASADVDRTGLERIRHRLVATMSRRLASALLSGVVDHRSGQVILIAVPWSQEEPRLAPALEAALLAAEVQSLQAGIGGRVEGLGALGTSSNQAIQTLEAIAAGAERYAIYWDALLEILIRSAPETAMRLAQHDLGAIEASGLLDTLRTHLEHDLSPQATAAAMRVHKNTVLYRLRRIAEISGLDFRKPSELARIVIGVRALELDSNRS